MISLNTIKNSSVYLAALQNITATQSSTVGGGSDAVSLAVYIQNVKNSIARAMVSERLAQEDEKAKSVLELDIAADDAKEVRRIETFSTSLAVLAGYDAESTADDPVIYVELSENGTVRSYRVRVNDIDYKDLTRVEAFALTRFMQDRPGWSDLTSADIVAAISNVVTGEGAEDPDKAPAADATMVDQIGRFLKTSSTYLANGGYAPARESSLVDFFDQTSAVRMNARALRLQNLLSNIVVDKDGRKTLSDGVYL